MEETKIIRVHKKESNNYLKNTASIILISIIILSIFRKYSKLNLHVNALFNFFFLDSCLQKANQVSSQAILLLHNYYQYYIAQLLSTTLLSIITTTCNQSTSKSFDCIPLQDVRGIFQILRLSSSADRDWCWDHFFFSYI